MIRSRVILLPYLVSLCQLHWTGVMTHPGKRSTSQVSDHQRVIPETARTCRKWSVNCLLRTVMKISKLSKISHYDSLESPGNFQIKFHWFSIVQNAISCLRYKTRWPS